MLIVWAASCSYTRYVPEGEALLWKQEIALEGEGRTGSAESILKQEPNAALLGWRPSLMLYNWGDGSDTSFFGKLGNPPVLYQDILSQRSVEQLENYYFNKGYFRVKGRYEIKERAKGKKVQVTYHMDLGPRFRVDSIRYVSNTNDMTGLINYFKPGREIKEGMFYDAERLDKERRRLKDIFRNHGYYDFSASYIQYEADTLKQEKPHQVDITLSVNNPKVRQGDTLVSRPHQKHRINKVVIRPDYRFLARDKASDTSQYLNYFIAYDTLEFAPRYLTDAVHFRAGQFYKQEKVSETYSHLANYNAFLLSEITFEPLPGDTGHPELLGLVKLKPMEKFSINTSLEATNTSNNYGINGSVGLTNRNIFGAGEALRFDVSGGLEYQPTVGREANLSRTFEVGVELALDFPRFVLPFNTIGVWPKRMQPQSSVAIFASRTERAEFDRNTYGAKLTYNWRENELKSHRVTLLNLSYSLITSEDSAFINELNPIQQLAFVDEFISSTSWGFTYNGQGIPNRNTYNFFRSDLEVGGTLQSTLSLPPDDDRNRPLYTIGNVPIYQFARLETDYRFYWRIDNERIWIQRLLLGYVFPYGVSNIESEGQTVRLPPFSRFFFLGGSNDLRAWPAYRVGGGSSQVTNYLGTASDSSGFAVGTLKGLLSSEFRFPIYGSVKGAVFADAGNIWLTGGLQQDAPKTAFEPEDLLRDMYLGSGFGLRIDLDFFVFRFDVGVKIRDPGFLDEGDEWVILTKPVFPNLAYNIALGYPF
mgnify:FL=1